AGLGSDPEFERNMEQQRGGEVSPLVQPVVAPFESAPGPQTAAQTQERPDQRGLEPLAAPQPEAGTDVQQPAAERHPLLRISIAPALPALAPARRHRARRS